MLVKNGSKATDSHVRALCLLQFTKGKFLCLRPAIYKKSIIIMPLNTREFVMIMFLRINGIHIKINSMHDKYSIGFYSSGWFHSSETPTNTILFFHCNLRFSKIGVATTECHVTKLSLYYVNSHNMDVMWAGWEVE